MPSVSVPNLDGFSHGQNTAFISHFGKLPITFLVYERDSFPQRKFKKLDKTAHLFALISFTQASEFNFSEKNLFQNNSTWDRPLKMESCRVEKLES